MHSYFVSYTFVPLNDSDPAKWGNAIVHLGYTLDTDEAISRLQDNLKEKLELAKCCLMFFTPIPTPPKYKVKD